MKQGARRSEYEELLKVSEYIWETFDGLFKAMHHQNRRVEELEARVADLERRLSERGTQPKPATQAARDLSAERAA
jgi:polyhydroxyalkanoate synthesis regulator phasin